MIKAEILLPGYYALIINQYLQIKSMTKRQQKDQRIFKSQSFRWRVSKYVSHFI